MGLESGQVPRRHADAFYYSELTWTGASNFQDEGAVTLCCRSGSGSNTPLYFMLRWESDRGIQYPFLSILSHEDWMQLVEGERSLAVSMCGFPLGLSCGYFGRKAYASRGCRAGPGCPPQRGSMVPSTKSIECSVCRRHRPLAAVDPTRDRSRHTFKGYPACFDHDASVDKMMISLLTDPTSKDILQSTGDHLRCAKWTAGDIGSRE